MRFKFILIRILIHVIFRDLYAAHMSDKFASELDRAFVSHELSGVLLGGLSKVSISLIFFNF